MRRHLAALLTAATALTASCAQPLPSSTTTPDGTTAPDTTTPDGTALRLPLDDYQHSPVQGLAVTNAYRVLLIRCARRHGRTLPITSSPRPLVGPRTWTERRYGLTDAADAASYGYGLGPRDPARHPPEPAPLDPATIAVITGTDAGRDVPPGGCQEETCKALAMAPAGADPSLPEHLSMLSFQRSRTDPRVRAAVEAWSACMRAAGHSYATPFDPIADPAFRDGTSQKELATARTDLACKKRTNLVSIWLSVESAYQRTMIAQNTTALQAAKRANETTLRLAQETLTAAEQPSTSSSHRRSSATPE
ncbi:hypothetical protein [Nonomuraea jiangxiensis]|uniref:PknH-like extracellular domain-containing protein n=1 Tax=Nonomuraea jiangxiensis TaxID=633440 RepID=A0A1G9HHZ9_9ACTN|nr:hypothetical protein [Nonomuraea jiangxiensis]SDL12537.1 hypothetical protein SAMN05421869_122114 [Nonomuraea jiangxiensis]